MGYSPKDHTESEMIEATLQAHLFKAYPHSSPQGPLKERGFIITPLIFKKLREEL